MPASALDIRGTGDSEGLIDDEYTVQEQLDGCDAIAWIAAQDWCDGQVAMIGISWGGFNGLQIAARQPPALKTIITVGSTDDRYATDIHWVGGCLSKDNFDWSSTMFAHQDLPPDPAIVGAAWRDDVARSAWRHNAPGSSTWLKHQRRDDLLEAGLGLRGFLEDHHSGLCRLRLGRQLLRSRAAPARGPARPAPRPDRPLGAFLSRMTSTVEPAIGWLQEVLRWCDHWMKGRDTGIMDEPHAARLDAGRGAAADLLRRTPRPLGGRGPWPCRASGSRRSLCARRRRPACGSAGAGEASICSPLWVGLAAGEIGRYGDDAEWPADQREDDGGSLVFVSEPLDGARRNPRRAATAPPLRQDKPQALVAVRLNDVAPDGRLDPGHARAAEPDPPRSHEQPRALVPGQRAEAVVELDDIAHAFPPGHRIAVSISTTYWPVAWPSPELATMTLQCGKSWLELPVRPAREGDDSLRTFEPAEGAETTPHRYLPVSEHPRRITRDLLSGRMTVDFGRWTEKKEMPDIGQTWTSRGLVRHEIVNGDPLSARTVTDYHVEVARADTVIEHHSVGTLSCDATHFRVEMDLLIRERGQEVFRRRWDERIERDHL